jgi:hypothetical protein
MLAVLFPAARTLEIMSRINENRLLHFKRRNSRKSLKSSLPTAKKIHGISAQNIGQLMIIKLTCLP